MTRKELIEELETIKDLVAWGKCEGLTDYAREHVYIDIEDAIEIIQENEE